MGMVGIPCDLSSWEEEPEAWQAQGVPGLHKEPCLKQTNLIEFRQATSNPSVSSRFFSLKMSGLASTGGGGGQRQMAEMIQLQT